MAFLLEEKAYDIPIRKIIPNIPFHKLVIEKELFGMI
jgi:hypothetical protein